MTLGRAETVAVGFVTTLRRSGLDVSLSSSLLYTDALAAVGLDNAHDVYWAGRATLVHRPEDIGVYDRVFGVYWAASEVQNFYQATVDRLPVTIALDDPDAPEQEGEGEIGETITVRYSAVETLSSKDFADYTDEELGEARRLMERIRLTGPTRSSRRR